MKLLDNTSVCSTKATRILSLLVISVITVASGYGQNPILDPNYTIDCSSECIAKDFPFQFCVVENGVAKFVRKCSSNPSDEEDANGNPMTVYKPNILAGLCTEYQKETSRFIENGIKKILNVIVRDEAGEQYVDYFDPRKHAELHMVSSARLDQCM